MDTKDTNPKDAVGIAKAAMSCVPNGVLMELGVAMMEGARKYGRHNYRIAGVRASVYYDAFMRHAMSWWEGEDIDPDSGLSHITKAIATLTVLRDAMMNDMVTDDRPPPMKNRDWLKELNARAAQLLKDYPDAIPPHTAKPTLGKHVFKPGRTKAQEDAEYLVGMVPDRCIGAVVGEMLARKLDEVDDDPSIGEIHAKGVFDAETH
jgi:hypothetical protein